MSQVTTNRLIRRAFRKRLLPPVEQCLTGRVNPLAIHHTRKQLDLHAASEILACMEGQHSCMSSLTNIDLLAMWDEWRRHETPAEVSIGNFCQYLYDQQIEYDEAAWSAAAEPKPSRSEQQERRLYTLATLFVAGYLEKFEPELLLC